MAADPPPEEAPWSDLAKQAYVNQFKIALQLRSEELEPEHLLIAVGELKSGAAFEIFKRAKADISVLKNRMAEMSAAKTKGKPCAPAPSERWRTCHKLLTTKAQELPLMSTGGILHGLALFFERAEEANPARAFLKAHRLSTERIETYAHDVKEPIQGDMKRGKDKRRIVAFGTPMHLVRETRWTRFYETEGRTMGYDESKFRDGSTRITPQELEREWTGWSEKERIDFCNSVSQADDEHAKGLLRFTIRHGNQTTWSCCAMAMATKLPTSEAVPFLKSACENSSEGRLANLTQALAFTKAPEAAPTIREILSRIWMKPAVWDEGGWSNPVAYDAICCIGQLIRLGDSPEIFRDKYNALLQHRNARTRAAAIDHLEKYFARPS